MLRDFFCRWMLSYIHWQRVRVWCGDSLHRWCWVPNHVQGPPGPGDRWAASVGSLGRDLRLHQHRIRRREQKISYHCRYFNLKLSLIIWIHMICLNCRKTTEAEGYELYYRDRHQCIELCQVSIKLNNSRNLFGFLLKWWTYFRQKRREMGSRTEEIIP